MFLMVPSCINATLAQAASLQVHTVCSLKTKVPHVSSAHLAFLFDKWKESLDTRSAFEKSLDLIDQPQPFQVEQHCANEWEEFLAHKALPHSCQGEFADELFPDPKGFTNKGAVPHSQDVPSWTNATMVEEIDDPFSLSHHLSQSLMLQRMSHQNSRIF